MDPVHEINCQCLFQNSDNLPLVEWMGLRTMTFVLLDGQKYRNLSHSCIETVSLEQQQQKGDVFWRDVAERMLTVLYLVTVDQNSILQVVVGLEKIDLYLGSAVVNIDVIDFFSIGSHGKGRRNRQSSILPHRMRTRGVRFSGGFYPHREAVEGISLEKSR